MLSSHYSSILDISDIAQIDGNVTTTTDENVNLGLSLKQARPNRFRKNRASVACHLPSVTICNMRSLFPKINNFKNDLIEREVDVSLLSEIWEKEEDKSHKLKIETMLEMEGLQYFSTPRP